MMMMMKILISKLNEVFEKSNNIYVRFLITLFIALIPFNLVCIVVFISIQNYLRGVVLILLLLVSFSEHTRDNKFVLGFIGIIPIGFYVVTSPLIAGWYLGSVAKDIGGIVFSNPVATIFSGVSIYGIIKTLKGASSIYEWFMNSGLGGYFFPEYKNLKDQINLKNQAMVQMVKNHYELLSSYESVKIAKERWKTIAIGFYDKLMTMTRLNPPFLPQIESSPTENIKIDTNMSLPPVVIAVQENQSIEVIDEQMMHELQKDEEETKKHNYLTEKIMQSQQIITIQQQQSTAIIPVSDATFTAVQKVLTGGGILVGAEILSKLIGTDSSFLLHEYDLLKQVIGPYMMPVAAYVTGEIAVKTTTIASGAFQETKNLVKKGIKNITENMKVIPNIKQSQDFIKIDVLKATTPEMMKIQLIEALKEAEKGKLPDTTIDPTKGQLRDINFKPNSTYIKEGIQDISLVRKPGYRDFVDPNDYKPVKPIIPPAPKPAGKDDKSIFETPHTWAS